ncbi:unnamed protein product [Boreogadus saida]
MLSAHSCVACMASLQVEDGHDQCPACLGVEHLREAVSVAPGAVPRQLGDPPGSPGVPAAAPAAAQPTYTEDDMLSTAASCSLFAEEEEQASLAS